MLWHKAAGWDIAITDDGPLVIEVNDSWDRTSQYFICRGWRSEIRKCYTAWKDRGYYPIVERSTNNLSQLDLKRLDKLFK